MRSRKPCVLARRRLFGWKVRLLTCTSPRSRPLGKKGSTRSPGTKLSAGLRRPQGTVHLPAVKPHHGTSGARPGSNRSAPARERDDGTNRGVDRLGSTFSTGCGQPLWTEIRPSRLARRARTSPCGGRHRAPVHPRSRHLLRRHRGLLQPVVFKRAQKVAVRRKAPRRDHDASGHHRRSRQRGWLPGRMPCASSVRTVSCPRP
jgi:hypothetical protein